MKAKRNDYGVDLVMDGGIIALPYDTCAEIARIHAEIKGESAWATTCEDRVEAEANVYELAETRREARALWSSACQRGGPSMATDAVDRFLEAATRIREATKGG